MLASLQDAPASHMGKTRGPGAAGLPPEVGGLQGVWRKSRPEVPTACRARLAGFVLSDEAPCLSEADGPQRWVNLHHVPFYGRDTKAERLARTGWKAASCLTARVGGRPLCQGYGVQSVTAGPLAAPRVLPTDHSRSCTDRAASEAG